MAEMSIEETIQILGEIVPLSGADIYDPAENNALMSAILYLERVKRLEEILTTDEKAGYTDEQILALLRTGEEW